jgi:hypothetical protein
LLLRSLLSAASHGLGRHCTGVGEFVVRLHHLQLAVDILLAIVDLLDLERSSRERASLN